jgi:hypothetical protein
MGDRLRGGFVLNFRRMMSVVALIALVTSGVACSGESKSGPSGQSKTTVTDSGFNLTAGTVTASAERGVAPNGTTVAMKTGAGPLPPEVANALTTTGDSVQISLNDGVIQPVSPVKLTFIVDSATAQAAISQGDAPVVFSKSADGTTELLPATYDAPTHSITATTTHFSSFWPDWFNPAKFFSGVVDNAKQLLGVSNPRPDCVGQSAVSQGVTYAVSSVTGDVAWPCISGDDSQLKLTLYSNSSLIYRVRTTPATSGIPAAELNLTGIVATAVYKELFARYADKESVLPAGGSVDFAFDGDNPPQDGALLSEPALAMVAVLVLGLDTAAKPFGLSLADNVAQNSGALECISGTAIAAALQDPTELVKATLTCIQQVQGTTLQFVVGTLLSGIPVLVSMIQGMWSEVNGTNKGTFTVTATGTRTVKAPDPVSEPAPAAGPAAGGCTMDPQSLALLRQSIAAQRATAAQATAAPPSYLASIEASAKVLEDQIAAAGC